MYIDGGDTPGTITISWDLISGVTSDVYHCWGQRTHSSNPVTFFNRWTFLGFFQPGSPYTSEDVTTIFQDELNAPITGERFAVAVRLVPGNQFAGPLTFASTDSV